MRCFVSNFPVKIKHFISLPFKDSRFELRNDDDNTEDTGDVEENVALMYNNSINDTDEADMTTLVIFCNLKGR